MFRVVFSILMIASLAGPAVAASKVLRYDKDGKAYIQKGTGKTEKNRRASGRQAPGRRTFSPDPTDPVNQFEPGELVVLDQIGRAHV